MKIGVASASHQCEDMRSNFRNCWDVFQDSFPGKESHPFLSGGKVGETACLGYTQAISYVRVTARAGYNIYRMSIEWARIQPHPNVFCATALQRYVDIAKAVHDSGMKLYLCLCHYTVPQWFVAEGAWLSHAAPDIFARYVQYVAGALAPYVDTFLTFNEVNVVSSGYIFAGMPAVGPHAVARMAYYGNHRPTPRASQIMERVNVNLLTSHARAKEIIRDCGHPVAVGLTISIQVMVGSSADQPLFHTSSIHLYTFHCNHSINFHSSLPCSNTCHLSFISILVPFTVLSRNLH
jgi:beta-glucosidase/6-phospho-beta-glucosidase/beta-galactosidase